MLHIFLSHSKLRFLLLVAPCCLAAHVALGAAATIPNGQQGTKAFAYDIRRINLDWEGGLSDFNRSGEGCGWYLSGKYDVNHAFEWSKKGLIDLTPCVDGESFALSLNSLGHIVGSSQYKPTGKHATLWEFNRTVRLPDMSGCESEATGINDSDNWCGWTSFTTTPVSLAIAKINGRFYDLSAGCPYDSFAFGINNKNAIVGFERDKSGNQHAAEWLNGKITFLTVPAKAVRSVAYRINDRGTIIGGVDGHAYVWHSSGFGEALDGATTMHCHALSLNNRDDIVGYYIVKIPNSLSSESEDRAALWHLGKLYDLNDLIPSQSRCVIETARTINDSGYISAVGLCDGQRASFILRPR